MGAPNRQTALSYSCSAILHGGLIAAVVWCALPMRMQSEALKPGVRTTISESTEADSADGVVWNAVRAGSTLTEAQGESARRTSVESLPSAASPGLAGFARNRLEQQREAAEDKSSEEQLAELESLARRLDRVANEDSVREVSGTLSEWLGANEREKQPADAEEDGGCEFDVGTAQISDVRKIESEEGIQYIALLVDARGCSKETVLDDIDGPRLYETFQLMKSFPLLETVYRRTVMGLLDELAAQTEPSSSADATPAPTMKTEQSEQ